MTSSPNGSSSAGCAPFLSAAHTRRTSRPTRAARPLLTPTLPLRQCAEMACVTKRPKAKKYCDNAGHFAGCLVFTIALSCALFTLYTNSEEYRDGSVEIDCGDGVTPDKAYNEVCKFDMGGAMKTFGYSRMFSFLARAPGLESAPHQQKCPATARARGCALERSWCQRLRPSPSPSTSPSCRGRALPRASSLSCS